MTQALHSAHEWRAQFERNQKRGVGQWFYKAMIYDILGDMQILEAQQAALLKFAEMCARFRKDDEPEGWVLENDDAVETLEGVIAWARELCPEARSRPCTGDA